jgi:preprotein translocase subunit YajC
MRLNLFGTILVGSTLALAGAVARAAQQPGSAPASSPGQDQGQGSGQGPGQGRRGRGMGGFPGGGRGVLGAVTEVAADHYTIKTDSGETYVVHYSANTRIVKQGPGRRQGGGGSGAGEGDGAERAAPQTLKPTDIKVGDFITAGGEVDTAAKSVGAVFIAQIDPERAKQMREMQANYGKTWLAGRITAIDGTTITIEGIVDHVPHSIVVDENTSFHQRRDAITLADIKPGEQLRAEGAVKAGAFLATTVTAMEPQNRGEGRDQSHDQPAGSPPKPQ